MSTPPQMTEDLALDLLFGLANLRAKQGLDLVEQLRLSYVCAWLRKNTDGQRMPEGA